MVAKGAGRAVASLASQTIEFGRLTATGAGGVAPTSTGSITAASIDSGVNAAHWAVSSAGVFTPAAALSVGPYTLGCTFTVGGVSGVAVTITINIVADAYSFATDAELTTILGISTATTAGKTALARSGTYTARTISSKSWASDFTISKHSGAPAIFQGILLNECNHFAVDGVEFFQDVSTAIALFEYYNNSNNITVKNCTIHAKYFDPTVNRPIDVPSPTNVTGIYASSGNPGKENSGNITVTNNTLYDLRTAIQLSGTGTFTVTSNTIHTICEDALRILGPWTAVPMPTVIIEDNTMQDFYATYTEDHPDGIQFGENQGTGDMTISVKRNAIVQTIGPVGNALQGIFGDFDHGGYLTGIIQGNLVVNYAYAGIQIEDAKNLTVDANTVVRWNHGGSGDSYQPRIFVGNETTSGTHVVTNNIGEIFEVGGSPTLTPANRELGNDGATLSYASTFQGSGGGGTGSFVPTSIANAIAIFAPRTGITAGAIPGYIS